MTPLQAFKSIWFHLEKHELAPTLYECGSKLPVKSYWKYVGEAWTRSESHYRQMDIWQALIEGAPRGCIHATAYRRNMMGAQERSFLSTLQYGGDQLIYRGGSREGWSWTLDRGKAIWFAKRWQLPDQKHGTLWSGVFNPKQAIAYMAGRGEGEIIIRPEYIKSVYKTEIDLGGVSPNSLMAKAVQDFGHSALFGDHREQGRTIAFLVAMNGKSPHDFLEHQQNMIDACRLLGAATPLERLEEYLAGCEEGLQEARNSPLAGHACESKIG